MAARRCVYALFFTSAKMNTFFWLNWHLTVVGFKFKFTYTVFCTEPWNVIVFNESSDFQHGFFLELILHITVKFHWQGHESTVDGNKFCDSKGKFVGDATLMSQVILTSTNQDCFFLDKIVIWLDEWKRHAKLPQMWQVISFAILNFNGRSPAVDLSGDHNGIQVLYSVLASQLTNQGCKDAL